MSAHPQLRKKGPDFDLTILEALDRWRKALIDDARAKRACAVKDMSETQRMSAHAQRAHATKRLAEARATFEETLKASIPAEDT